MKLAHIKTGIINKASNSCKNTRNNYADNIGTRTRYRKAMIKYRQTITGNCTGINTQQLNELKKQWQEAGGSIKDFNRLGTIKIRQILKGY